MRLALLLLFAATSRTPAPPAAVHATLVSSEPAANSRLDSSPSRIRLVFSEPMEGSLARVTIVPASGDSIRLRAAADPRNVNAVIAVVDSLTRGAYRVNWRVVSADGHPVDGTFTFAIGDTTLGATAALMPDSAVVAQPEHEPEPESDATTEDDAWGPSVYGAPFIPALFRGAALAALMIVAGLLFFHVRAGPNALQAGDARVRSAMTMAAVAAPVLLAAHVLTWLINTAPDHTFDMAWSSAAMGTTVGQVELWRTGLATLALLAWWIARRASLALLFAAAALAVSGATGHSAAIVPLLSIPAKGIHLLAGGVWVGGLVWLIARPSNDTDDCFAEDASRVSGAALVAVIAVALSGVVQTLTFLPSVRDVFTSPYGWFALAKTAGVLVLVGFGAYHRQRAMPRLVEACYAAARTPGAARGVDASVPMRASVRRELVVMAIVILLGGLLAYVPPPGEGDDMSTSAESPTS
jgi:copper transport protein